MQQRLTNEEILRLYPEDGAALSRAIIKLAVDAALGQNPPEEIPPEKGRRESTLPNKRWRDGKCRVMRGTSEKRCKWCMTCPWIQPDGEINYQMLMYCLENPEKLALYMLQKIYPDFGA